MEQTEEVMSYLENMFTNINTRVDREFEATIQSEKQFGEWIGNVKTRIDDLFKSTEEHHRDILNVRDQQIDLVASMKIDGMGMKSFLDPNTIVLFYYAAYMHCSMASKGHILYVPDEAKSIFFQQGCGTYMSNENCNSETRRVLTAASRMLHENKLSKVVERNVYLSENANHKIKNLRMLIVRLPTLRADISESKRKPNGTFYTLSQMLNDKALDYVEHNLYGENQVNLPDDRIAVVSRHYNASNWLYKLKEENAEMVTSKINFTLAEVACALEMAIRNQKKIRKRNAVNLNNDTKCRIFNQSKYLLCCETYL